jgi:5'-deoxynucleotidase YfbR-like HD superfamily hydrolase
VRRDAAPRVWQRMLSGRRLDLLNPSPLDIELEDIVHGLARVARWNGQTIGPYIFSVAQHSLLVEAIGAAMEPGLADAGRLGLLLHDAPEYVIGDIISPLKAVIGGDYKDVERRLLAAIHLRFALPPEPGEKLRRLIKKADRAAAFLEATRLAGFSRQEAVKLFGQPGVAAQAAGDLLEPWPIEAVEQRLRLQIELVCGGSGACQPPGPRA